MSTLSSHATDYFHRQNSNVVNFFSTLKKDDPKEQLVYYQVCCIGYHFTSANMYVVWYWNLCNSRGGFAHYCEDYQGH